MKKDTIQLEQNPDANERHFVRECKRYHLELLNEWKRKNPEPIPQYERDQMPHYKPTKNAPQRPGLAAADHRSYLVKHGKASRVYRMYTVEEACDKAGLP